ncbi:Sel1 repeat-containing protein [Cohaesibacter sp. ES.047]|uniref:tetratricopeptide repeat protein n=1 Tax=Cohaesibacter sp. ES.047 TaxID=1798205 RepID=UPI000BB8B029|nr:SEL1-like repeat protein [Cohaesibacter sp. ES.047]SNY92673.1 Sel1 repeat-containing protein [Cohaesibacter sp. ES.047]
MNFKPGLSMSRRSMKMHAVLAAALMMSVWGSVASAAEIQTSVTKVGDEGKIELRLPENTSVMVGDKVRLEAQTSGEDPVAIKTRWTIKAIKGSVIEARPDGEPTSDPEVGYQAVINTIAEQVASMDAEEKSAASDEKAETPTDAKPEAVPEPEAEVASKPEPSAQDAVDMLSDEAPDTTVEDTTTEDTTTEDTTTEIVDDATAVADDTAVEDAAVDGEPTEEMATEDVVKEGMATEGVAKDETSTGEMPEDVKAEMPKPSTESTKAAEPVEAETPSNERAIETAEVETAEKMAEPKATDSAKEEVAKAEPEPEQIKDPSDVTECDTLAAHPFDPEAIASGVEYQQLDAEKVITACEQAIADLPDVPRFYTQLTRGLHKAGRLKEAFEATKKGAELGSAHSMAFLGVMYSQGKIMAKDDAKSLEWYEKAAEKGNPGGMIFAAAMYRDGTGTERDYQRAAELYKMAAELDVAEAMTSLAIFHDRGLGVEKDIDEATRLIMRAYRLKDREARKLLFEAPGAMSLPMRKEIQTRLKAEGFYRSAIDGDFGRGTRDALIKFSRAQ